MPSVISFNTKICIREARNAFQLTGCADDSSCDCSTVVSFEVSSLSFESFSSSLLSSGLKLTIQNKRYYYDLPLIVKTNLENHINYSQKLVVGIQRFR